MIANANPKEPNRESRFRLRFALFIALQALATAISVSAQTQIPFEQEWTKLIAKAPHPSAAKLFINWFLSREGQTLTHTLIPNIDRASLRTDIPYGEVVAQHRRVPGKEYAFPDADPGYGARSEEAQKWILKLWESRQR